MDDKPLEKEVNHTAEALKLLLDKILSAEKRETHNRVILMKMLTNVEKLMEWKEDMLSKENGK